VRRFQQAIRGVTNLRLVAGILVLAALGLFAALVAPIYVRAFELRHFVSGLTHNVEAMDRPDEAVRGVVLAKARSLSLPVTASGVQITRKGEDVRINVKYVVQVDLPGYAVQLHF
jgi:hypothetical protein